MIDDKETLLLRREIASLLQKVIDLKTRVAELEAALRAFRDAAEYDVLMEGPAFKGWNRSQLMRALRDSAALAQENGK